MRSLPYSMHIFACIEEMLGFSVRSLPYALAIIVFSVRSLLYALASIAFSVRSLSFSLHIFPVIEETFGCSVRSLLAVSATKLFSLTKKGVELAREGVRRANKGGRFVRKGVWRVSGLRLRSGLGCRVVALRIRPSAPLRPRCSIPPRALSGVEGPTHRSLQCGRIVAQ